MKHVTFIMLLALCTSCSKPSPEATVHRIMNDQQLTLAIAESCTGGALSARFTAQSGASVYFRCGIVAYNQESKRKLLGVNCATIGLHGVVSEQVACEMAEGIRKATGANYAIATTGFAGPDGGTPEAPVGTVWIAIATPNHIVSERFFEEGTRKQIVDNSSTVAIELLLRELQKELPDN